MPKKEENTFHNVSINSNLTASVIGFSLYLKDNGFRIYQNSIIDCLRSLSHVDIFDKNQFRYALRANLACMDLEWKQFDNLFDNYWNRHSRDFASNTQTLPSEKETEEGELTDSAQREAKAGIEMHKEVQFLEGIAYSPVESLEKKDLGSLSSSELNAASLALRVLIEPFRIYISRRRSRSKRGPALDFYRIMRAAMKLEGDPVTLYFKSKKRRLRRLFVLTDVSGSMDRYAGFVLPFVLGFRGIGAKAQVFVFSTTLTCITHFIKKMNLQKALERMGDEIPGWSGGTRIGQCLKRFNQCKGSELTPRRSVIMFLSDGWDLGSKEMLIREMSFLRRKAYKVIWLNPLEGDLQLRSIGAGMRAAAGFIDHILPVGNLADLRKAGRLLKGIMVR